MWAALKWSFTRLINCMMVRICIHALGCSKFFVPKLRFAQFSTSTYLYKNAISSHESSINGAKIFWEKAGEGSHNVLMLPGALGSSRTDFLPQLENLNGSKFTLYCWDPTGYGKSRPPNRTWPDKFFSRDACDAAALIKDIGMYPNMPQNYHDTVSCIKYLFGHEYWSGSKLSGLVKQLVKLLTITSRSSWWNLLYWNYIQLASK